MQFKYKKNERNKLQKKYFNVETAKRPIFLAFFLQKNEIIYFSNVNSLNKI